MKTFSDGDKKRLSLLWCKRKDEGNVSRVMHEEEEESIREERLIRRREQEKRKKRNNRTISHSSHESGDRSLDLQTKARSRLSMSRFRAVNHFLYTHTTGEAVEFMDESSFSSYHSAYNDIANKWPIRPIDVVCERMQRLFPSSDGLVFADMGCGPEPLVAKSFPKAVVHSFDLVSVSEAVTACDATHVPLPDSVCDCVVFSLSLMGCNVRDQVKEGARILKKGTGVMMIAEVASRFRSEKTEDEEKKRKKTKSQEEEEEEDKQPDEDPDQDVDSVSSFVEKCASLGLQLDHEEEIGGNNFFILMQFTRRGLTDQEKKRKKRQKDRKRKRTGIGGQSEMRLKACQYKPR